MICYVICIIARWDKSEDQRPSGSSQAPSRRATVMLLTAWRALALDEEPLDKETEEKRADALRDLKEGRSLTSQEVRRMLESSWCFRSSTRPEQQNPSRKYSITSSSSFLAFSLHLEVRYLDPNPSPIQLSLLPQLFFTTGRSNLSHKFTIRRENLSNYFLLKSHLRGTYVRRAPMTEKYLGD